LSIPQGGAGNAILVEVHDTAYIADNAILANRSARHVDQERWGREAETITVGTGKPVAIRLASHFLLQAYNFFRRTTAIPWQALFGRRRMMQLKLTFFSFSVICLAAALGGCGGVSGHVSQSGSWSIGLSQSGNFAAGGNGQYAITVTNGSSTATSGTVTVTDTLPSVFTPTSISRKRLDVHRQHGFVHNV
jgi:uncharacterized repeat protein (TIGR01451 family)